MASATPAENSGHVSLVDTIRSTLRRMSMDLTAGHENRSSSGTNSGGSGRPNMPHHHHDFHDLAVSDIDDDLESTVVSTRDDTAIKDIEQDEEVDEQDQFDEIDNNDDLSTNPSRNSRLGHSVTMPVSTTFELDNTPPLTALTLVGYRERTKTRLLSPTLAEEIRHLLPLRLQLYDTWRLCYSLEQHGVSLRTLYDLSVPPRGVSRPGYLILVEDTAGGVFGAYMNEYPHPTKNGRYYGNGECFLWKSKVIPRSINGSTTSLPDSASTRSVNIQFKAFPYTGINDYMILCDSMFLSVGGGDGKYGLYLDDRFDKGISASCPAFGNEPLSDTGTKFDVVGVEIWRISSM
ncbi:TLD-domain-containing protein [Lipomyces oligophaga]|uniref:TLD-domain-containing protein n=1 Tax=Lipomyces oligophaga TaxID=45792 RepID=UPI0034CFDCBB